MCSSDLRPILLRGDRGERLASESALNEPYFVAANIIEAVKIIAQKRRPILPGEAFVEGPSGRIRPPLAAPMSVARVAPAPVAPAPIAPAAPTPIAPQPVVPVAAPVIEPVAPVLVSSEVSSNDSSVDVAPAPTPVLSPSVQNSTSSTIATASPASAPAPLATLDTGLATQILQELRNQRQTGQDFSYLHVLAILLQMIVIVCLLGSYWLGSKDLPTFERFIGTGILLQLMTIAALIFRR